LTLPVRKRHSPALKQPRYLPGGYC
jgi:hypothetical protein